MNIRDEGAEDAGAIRALTSAAFAGAPHASGTEAAIVDGLRAAGALTLSLVAAEGGQVVGHAAFSPVTIEGEAGLWFGLGPLSVEPRRQRQGIGTSLVRTGLARLTAIGAEGCVVLGDPAYYGRFGFASDGQLRYGNVPVQYLQRLVLAGRPPSGEVSYHEAFGGA